ncbi:MAG: TonB-dependent receptor [Balneolaceae bacterium]|nr:TonB-dependent receptor [Balneolaceae bacterium]MDR9446547.1 TonB-dependent receptor [Balneolaceae bacterium]
MKTLATTLLALFFGALSYAQTGQLTGVVLDSESNLALPGATVQVEGTTFGTSANQFGEFRLSGLPAGEHVLIVSYIGYQNTEIDFTIEAFQTTAIEVTLESGILTGDEVVVLGVGLQGQAAALNQQKANANITNVVASDQVGRFPDANIGDALKRIPGITTQVDQGEARFGLIRGTAPRLNSVTINGERIPSAEAEDRTVQLDLVPADMIKSIEVNKAVTPDMDADAIGASVNLITRAAPNGLRVSGTLGSGYNFLRDEPIYLGSVVVGNRFADGKLGVIVSGSIHDHKLGSHNYEADWEDGAIDEFQVRLYDLQRVRRSVSTTIDYNFNKNNSVTFKALYNHRDDWENRFRTDYEKIDDLGNGEALVRIKRQTKGGIGNDRVDYRRLEDQRAMAYSLAGKHVTSSGIDIDWMGAYAKASEKRPNERYIRFEAGDDDRILIAFDPTNTRFPIVEETNFDPSAYLLDEITEERQYTEDIDKSFRLNLELPVGDFASFIKAGAAYKQKDKLRDNDFFEYKPLGSLEDQFATMASTGYEDKSPDNYEAGDYKPGNFASEKLLGDLDLQNSSLFEKEPVYDEYFADNFEATETVVGAYAMTNYAFNDRFSVIAGVRLEATEIEYAGNQLVLDEEGDFDQAASRQGISNSENYSNVMPGLHARFAVDANTIIRAAWTNTIARPNYYDLVPYRAVELEDEGELAEGNPTLEPTTSMNFDIMAERYFSNVGLVSGGVFYKTLQDFIYVFENRDYLDPVTGTVFGKRFQPKNGDDASLFGAEIAIQRQLDFLPGALSNLGIYLNYTYVTSSADGIRNEDGEVRDDLDLPGTAENTLNASLSYEDSKFSARVSLNYTTDYIDEIGEDASFDRYYDEQTFVDANAAYAITSKLRFFVEAKNLTNQPLRFYQGSQDFTMQSEYYSYRVNTGLKFDF